MIKNNNIQVKSKKRVADHGEVFTSEREVNAMLDFVKHESERIESRFLEPACGTGNFLVEVLRRKLSIVKLIYSRNDKEFQKYSIVAISSIYGVDLLLDNIEECKERLFSIFAEHYSSVISNTIDNDINESVKFILDRNILCGDALTLTDSLGEAIIFSEWSLVSNKFIKRRDFKLAELLMFPPTEDKHHEDLFSFEVENKSTIRVFREFPLVEYWRIFEHV